MFTKPSRKQVKLRAGIAGPTGSGKTQAALALATGLTDGGKIAVINTEVDYGLNGYRTPPMRDRE